MSSEYKTIRYIKKENLNLTNSNSSASLRARMEQIGDGANLVVRLRVNSPVYVEEALELNRENIHKITQDS